MRLAYQDMSIERKKQEERLKQTDPRKAEQMERLGMGFGGSRYVIKTYVVGTDWRRLPLCTHNICFNFIIH